MAILSTDELIQALRSEEDVFRKSRLVHALRVDKELPIKDIANRIEKHPSYISHLLRLLKLPQLVIDGYYAEQISATHLMILSRLATVSEMTEAYEEILKKNLTAGQTEVLIRQYKYDVTDDPGVSPQEYHRLEQKLQKKLEAKVHILQSRVRGKIVIEKRGNATSTTAFIQEIINRLQRSIPKEEQKNVVTVLE